jgi:hypothetical protein
MDTGRLIYFGFFCAGCAAAAILIISPISIAEGAPRT